VNLLRLQFINGYLFRQVQHFKIVQPTTESILGAASSNLGHGQTVSQPSTHSSDCIRIENISNPNTFSRLTCADILPRGVCNLWEYVLL
jgi:hypothetical protein